MRVIERDAEQLLKFDWKKRKVSNNVSAWKVTTRKIWIKLKIMLFKYLKYERSQKLTRRGSRRLQKKNDDHWWINPTQRLINLQKI
jgi:hypothetical protein